MSGQLHMGGWRLRQARFRIVQRALRAGAEYVRCQRCGTAIDLQLSGLHPDGLTVGHILPVSMGGDDRVDNLGPEHRRCNLAAGSRVAPPRASVVEPIHYDYTRMQCMSRAD